MNVRRIAAIMVAVASNAARLEAATAILTMYPNQNATGEFASGQFRITAKVLGNDSAGLASYGADLFGDIRSLDHSSPRAPIAIMSTKIGPTGFTHGRTLDFPIPPLIRGLQDLENADCIPIYGFGQLPGSFASRGITVVGSHEGDAWQSELLLATGSFVGPAKSIGFNQNGPNRAAKVFLSDSGIEVKTPETLLFVRIPEPSSAALALALMLGGGVVRLITRFPVHSLA